MLKPRVAISLAVATTLIALTATSTIAVDETLRPLQVAIAATEATGPAGTAIVSSVEAGTAVQVLVPGAADGTTATIHSGTCDRIGADLVGLIGQLSATGQAQATVPVPVGQLADGNHVIALHPGLDFSMTSGCGQIPRADAAAGPVVAPEDPPAAAGAACAGVTEWVTTTKTRLARLTELQTELARQVDSSGYVTTLASNVGHVQAMLSTMQSETVPASAQTVHQQFVAALQAVVVASTEIMQSFATGDTALYQRALTRAQDAGEEIVKVTTAAAQLEATCPAPAPG